MRYKCVVSYDGSRFAGWQKQAADLTVQETIEKAISRIVNHEVVIVGSGRTDAKVHALGKSFILKLKEKLAVFKRLLTLNYHLIFILKVLKRLQKIFIVVLMLNISIMTI